MSTDTCRAIWSATRCYSASAPCFAGVGGRLPPSGNGWAGTVFTHTDTGGWNRRPVKLTRVSCDSPPPVLSEVGCPVSRQFRIVAGTGDTAAAAPALAQPDQRPATGSHKGRHDRSQIARPTIVISRCTKREAPARTVRGVGGRSGHLAAGTVSGIPGDGSAPTRSAPHGRWPDHRAIQRDRFDRGTGERRGHRQRNRVVLRRCRTTTRLWRRGCEASTATRIAPVLTQFRKGMPYINPITEIRLAKWGDGGVHIRLSDHRYR